MSQQSAFEYIRHGQIPFFRLPLANLAARGSEAYRGSDAVVLGVPYDGGTTYQPGARFGPYHVRRVSALIQGFDPALKLDPFQKLSVVDGGNIALPPFNDAAARELIHAEIAAVLESGAAPFLVGGDHSITLPALRAVEGRHGPIAVVHVDAHFDTSGPEVWGESHHHGTPFRHALENGLIERGQLHQVAIRVTWKNAAEREFSDAHGASVYGMDEIDARGIEGIARAIKQAIGDRPTYVSFDIDAVDPAFAPGTGTPVPGGLTSREALRLLRQLAGVHIVGMDVVEVAPALDHADATVNLAAHLLFTGLGLLAIRR